MSNLRYSQINVQTCGYYIFYKYQIYTSVVCKLRFCPGFFFLYMRVKQYRCSRSGVWRMNDQSVTNNGRTSSGLIYIFVILYGISWRIRGLLYSNWHYHYYVCEMNWQCRVSRKPRGWFPLYRLMEISELGFY